MICSEFQKFVNSFECALRQREELIKLCGCEIHHRERNSLEVSAKANLENAEVALASFIRMQFSSEGS